MRKSFQSELFVQYTKQKGSESVKKMHYVCVLLLIIIIGSGLYYYLTYVHKSEDIMGGTFVKKIESYLKECRC